MSITAQCARLEVPKNRARPGSGTLSLHIARLPANTPHPEPDPFILLAGGPGQSASALAPFAASLLDLRRNRDIFLIDQRGTGHSSPIHCDALDAHAPFLSEAIVSESALHIAQCLEQLKAQVPPIDPLDYGTLAFVADLEDVRNALHLTQINLWGGSYGTRVALEYLRQHPTHLRTLALDGIVAPSTRIILKASGSRELHLTKLLKSCEHSEACRTLQPSPIEIFDTLATRLSAPGRTIVFASPKTGEPETLRFDFDKLLSVLQTLLYTPQTAALLPQILTDTLNENYAPLIALAQNFSSKMEGQLNPALYYAITCAEDIPSIRPDERLSLQSLRTHSLVSSLFSGCKHWPSAALPVDWGTPVENDTTPVLLLSGALDPVTPPEEAADVARTLSQHRMVTVGGAGHIVSTYACAPEVLTAFVKNARLDSLPKACIKHLEESKAPLLWSNRFVPLP